MLNQIVTQMNGQVNVGDIVSIGTNGSSHWIVDDNGQRHAIDREAYFQVLLATSDTADLDATLEAASIYGQRQ